MRAIALDLENAQVGLLGAALQIERRVDLLLLRQRLLEALLVLFLIDPTEVTQNTVSRGSSKRKPNLTQE